MSQPSSARTRTPLGDSPWFWVMTFCAAGVVFLLVISPKYAQRQRRLELQYYARQEIARRQVEGTDTAREPGDEGSAAPPAPGELIIPLWPLVAFFSALGAVAAMMLARQRRLVADMPAAPEQGRLP